mgnify:CR=1 FL=1
MISLLRRVGVGTSSRRLLLKFIVAVQVGSLLQSSLLYANPNGGTVVAGSAAIGQSGNTLTIQQFSDRAVINWQDFSIQPGETTRFIQPDSSSAVLNRVTGGNPSAILGTLEANGNVYVINPNGILVGANASVNVNGLVASTLDVNNSMFMQGGDLTFQGSSRAGVANYGTIRALEGDIYLIGATVENHGTLQAASGRVGLAAGQSVQIIDSAHPSLVVRATEESIGGTGIHNTGIVEAAQAELIANGGNVYALAINNEGIVRATGSETRGGRVFLIADGGKIRSTGDLIAKKGINGGDVLIHAGGQPGSEIEIRGTIDVSGEEYGGAVGMKAASILLGGSKINLTGSIEDGVKLISLGSSSAEIADPKNGGFLDYSGQNNTVSMSITDNDTMVTVTDDTDLKVQGGSITTDSGDSFTDVMFTAANSGEFISFITFNLDEQTGMGAPTVGADATITFTVVLQKPTGPDEIVVLEASWADISSSGKISIQATGGDLIKKITFNSDADGPGGSMTPFINEIKQIADVELASGSIIIEKVVTDGSDTSQEFQYLVTSDDTELPAGADFLEVFLMHGEDEAVNLLAGTYDVQEVVPTGWFLDSIMIIGDENMNSSSDLSTATATVGLDAGEIITVKYTNTQGAQITVVKETVGPDGATTDFDFTTVASNGGATTDTSFMLNGTGGTNSITLDSTEQTDYVRPGTYTISELAEAGWFFDSVTGTGVVDTSNPSQMVTVGAGGSVTLTYTNTQGAQITVVKETVGPDGATTDFDFTTEIGRASCRERV